MSIFRKLLFSYWYFRKPPWDTNQTPPEVYDFIENHRPGRALDLGCGTGTNAITLAKNGWQVIGVDFVNKAIETAIKKAKKEQVDVDFRVGDVTNLLGIDGVFDFVLDIGCFHILDSKGKESYRKNLFRFLDLGGTYLLYAFIKGPESKNGVLADDIDAFSPQLSLISQKDGWERGSQPSFWVTFHKDQV